MSHGGGGEEGDSNRWLVSYADFITLLMVMFVVLYSMGQVDVKKYKQLSASLNAAFSVGGGPVKAVDSRINQGSGSSSTEGVSKPITIPGLPKRPLESSDVASNLSQMLSQNNLTNQVNVQTNVEGVLVSLSEKLTFTPGTSELQPQAKPVLDSIIKMLLETSNKVRIIGHTDNTPPVDKRFTNNWELSVSRAIVIADYLMKNNITPDRITVSGRGEYEPIFANDTPEHRALNSRADVVIVYKLQSEVVDVNTGPGAAGAQTAVPQGTSVPTTPQAALTRPAGSSPAAGSPQATPQPALTALPVPTITRSIPGSPAAASSTPTKR